MPEHHLHRGDAGGAPRPAAELDPNVGDLPRVDVQASHPGEAPGLGVGLQDHELSHIRGLYGNFNLFLSMFPPAFNIATRLLSVHMSVKLSPPGIPRTDPNLRRIRSCAPLSTMS